MMKSNEVHAALGPFLGFRRRRMERFLKRFPLTPETTLVDLGGRPEFWREVDPMPAITLVNIERGIERKPRPAGMELLVASALEVPLPDQSFDIAFSNSVIEHVGTWENQQRFAAEVRRLGRSFWVQTPAKEFPVEPHYIAPFIHWMPRGVQRKLLRNATVWGWGERPSPQLVEEKLDEIRLLTRREVERLFPDCEIIVERFMGIPKSYIAYRRASAA